jgi:HSP20 family protein
MALIRWEPVRELHTMQSEMNRLFNTFFDSPNAGGNGAQSPLRRWIPAMDVVETEDHFVLRADLPGLSEDDVNIELDDNVLTISGQRKSEHEQRNEGYYRVERAFGSFSRSLTLPEGVDAEGIEASFDNGVLEVRIPKPEQQKPRKVQISLGGANKAIEGTEQTEPAAPAAGSVVSEPSIVFVAPPSEIWTLRGLCCSGFGIRTSSTPLSKLAWMPSASTPSGSVSDRENDPDARSTR